MTSSIFAKLVGEMHLRIIIYLIFFVTLFKSLTINGQAYNFINYGIGDGLAHEKIVDICEDKFGNLWLATSGGGLSRFNGLEFDNFTIKNGLASNYIRSVLSDRNGNIWAATASGISRLDGLGIINLLIDSTDISNNSVSVLHEAKDGTIWFAGSQGGIGKIDSLLNVTFLDIPGLIANDKIIAINEDSDGNVWFLSAIHGLFQIINGSCKSIINNSDFKGYLLSLYIDDNDMAWLGSNKGLLRFNLKKSSFDELDIILDGTFIKSAEVYDKDEIWVVSASGALKYDHNVVKSFSSNQGLTDTGINIIYHDREGNIWFGSDGDGLFKLTNESFVFYGADQGLITAPITSIVKDKLGKYWFGSFGNGLVQFDGNEFSSAQIDSGFPNLYISASTVDSLGNVWFGTRGSGIVKFDGSKYVSSSMDDGLVYNYIRHLFVDSKSNLWIGTPNGISKFDGQNFENFTVDNGLMDNVIWGISEPRPGYVLIVTREGFNSFENNKLAHIPIDSTIFDKRLNTAILDEQGNYWIGYSGHGLLKVASDGTQEFFTVDQGLTSDLIYNLLIDRNGDILVGSERGLDKIILDGEKNVKRIKNYDQIEGFKNLETTYGVTFQEDNGSIWFGTDLGVFRFDDFNVEINRTQPLTYISGIKLFYNEVDWSQYAESVSSWLNIPKGLELPYSENNLIFEYFGSSLRNSENVTYKFRLKGLETQWSPVTSKREAVYTNLSPGKYTFEVMAANSDGIWNDEPAILSFSIVPPFWQKLWFYAILTAVFIGSIKLYNDYRIRANLNKILTLEKIRSEELLKVRKRMARDFHDNMGNQLASITVFTNLINLKLKNKSKEIDDLLSNIQKHTKSLFTGTKDFIWSMDPESDNLAEIFTYIKDFGEDLFNNTEIEFYSKSDDLLLEYPLPSGWSRQLVLIFKEAMTNVLKHADATEVYLELNLSEKVFVISLGDNGKGLPIDQSKTGMGMKNMITRANQINGKITYSNSKGNKGTIVKFEGLLKSEQSEQKII